MARSSSASLARHRAHAHEARAWLRRRCHRPREAGRKWLGRVDFVPLASAEASARQAYAPPQRHTDRRVRNHRRAWRRRHGRGLPRPRHQAAIATSPSRSCPTLFATDPDRAGALQARGADAGRAQSSAHRARSTASKKLATEAPARARHGARRGRRRSPTRIARGPHAARRRAADRAADRRRARGRARDGHRPSRPEARQRQGHAPTAS